LVIRISLREAGTACPEASGIFGFDVPIVHDFISIDVSKASNQTTWEESMYEWFALQTGYKVFARRCTFAGTSVILAFNIVVFSARCAESEGGQPRAPSNGSLVRPSLGIERLPQEVWARARWPECRKVHWEDVPWSFGGLITRWWRPVARKVFLISG